MGPDTLCHIPAGQPHYQQTRLNESVLMYVIRYCPKLLPQALSSQLAALGMISLDLTTSSVNHSRIVKSLFQEMLFEQEACQGDWEALMQSRLIDLTVRMLRLARRRGRVDQPAFEGSNDSADRVARYALRLKSHFFRQQTTEEAARSCGLSRRQFTTLFRKVTGQSWRQHLLSLRLKHAGKLLMETDSSVLAVAFESGFEDGSHFHHSFKSTYGCSPLEYREQHRVLLDSNHRRITEPVDSGQASSGFKFRGMKGWFWTTEQYLEEITVLSSLRMNFLMNCCGSVVVSRASEPGCIEWWKPMSEASREAYSRIIRECQNHRITFCFSLQPRLAAPRQLDTGSAKDLKALIEHFTWAQRQQVQWFSLCLGGTGWGNGGPSEAGVAHAGLVNTVFSQLRAQDPNAQFILCPVACWGDGSNPEHHAYLDALARDMDSDVYVFWCGDSIVTPRTTRVAAEGFKSVVRHRLFLWDNYPVNDANPTLHLGPLRGRDSDLSEVIEGYLSNPMCTQNQINRLPLATCADYASNPRTYDPARAIAQAIVRLGKTKPQQEVLRDLVEAYPGFIVAGGGTGTNPVRAKLANILAGPDCRPAAHAFIERIEDASFRLRKLFPGRFPATNKTVQDDIDWMKHQLGEAESQSH